MTVEKRDIVVEKSGPAALLLKNALKEEKRQKKILRKRALAILALRPIVTELATGSKEWPDTSGFSAELMDKAGEMNLFVVEGDNDTTFCKAINFLLQEKDQNLHTVAGILLADRQIDGLTYDQAVEQLKDLLSRKINPKKANLG